MSLMVCRYPELDGNNVPHGLGVRRGILLACHGLFSWSKIFFFRKKLTSPKILHGNTKITYCVSTNQSNITKNQPTMRPPRARLCLGEGARCSVLLKFLRPSKVVAETIVNPVKDQRLDDLITVSREVTTWGGRTFVSIFY
jgi:hypothetical protein